MIKDLISYQETDAKLRTIEVALSGSPARKKAGSAKAYIESVEENVNKLDDRASVLDNEYQLAIKQQAKLNEQLEELKKALESAEDDNELNYLSKKAEELANAIKKMVAQVNKISEEMQKIVSEYASIRAKAKSAQAQYAEAKAEYDKLKASYQAEREEIAKQLATLKKAVDPALMEKYERKRANKMFPIVFEVTGEVCGACQMELSLLEKNKLKNGEVIECDQCGRILYKK